MNTIGLSVVVAACVFAGGMTGLVLHRFLPETHLTKETQDVVRLGTGMLSVLASLVLGLLIATAKTSSDNTDTSFRGFASDLILLHETLRDYGDTAAVPQSRLRDFTVQTLHDVWPRDPGTPSVLDDSGTGVLLEHVRETIRALKPVDDGQRWLKDQALTIVTSLLHQRWQLIERAGPNVRSVVLGILVCWIAAIFASFGLNAPRNMTVIAAFFVCSLAIGGAVFMILEMDSPFVGILKISDGPMINALAHMPPVQSAASLHQG